MDDFVLKLVPRWAFPQQIKTGDIVLKLIPRRAFPQQIKLDDFVLKLIPRWFHIQSTIRFSPVTITGGLLYTTPSGVADGLTFFRQLFVFVF